MLLQQLVGQGVRVLTIVAGAVLVVVVVVVKHIVVVQSCWVARLEVVVVFHQVRARSPLGADLHCCQSVTKMFLWQCATG